MTIHINDEKVVNVLARAEGVNKTVDLDFRGILPKNGIIGVRFRGGTVGGAQREAMIQGD